MQCQMQRGASKGQLSFGYGHKIMIEGVVYFKQEVQSNILL